MPTLVVTGASPDMWIQANGVASYTDGRNLVGSSFTVLDQAMYVGQSPNAGPTFYAFNEGFFQFVTSGVPAGANIQSVTLALWGLVDQSLTDFEVLIAEHDFGGGAPDSADFLGGDALAAKTPLASFDTSGFVVGAYNTFVSSDREFARAINRGGNTRLVMYSNRMATGIVPTQNEYVRFEQENAAGTTNDPKLTITYSVDMVVEVSLSNLSGDTDEECGVSFRLSDTGNFLAAYVDDGDNLVHLSKFVAGVETSIATAAWTPTDTAEIRVICQDNRLRVWVDGKLVIDATDSTHDGNERAGLFSRSTTAVLYSDFYAGAI